MCLAFLAAFGIAEWRSLDGLMWFWGGLGIMLALDWMGRLAALSLALLWAWALGTTSPFGGLELWLLPLMLIAHALQKRAPYGSLAAWGRSDPRGDWRFHPRIRVGLWLVLAVGYLLGPLIEGWNPLPSFGAWPAEWGWQIVAVQLLFVPMVLSRRTRRWAWLTLLIAQAVCLVVGAFPRSDLDVDPMVRWVMLLLHAFTFDPAWLPPRRPAPGTTIFFDGECGLCHGFVRFVLAEDRAALFRLAPLQSAAFSQELSWRTPPHGHKRGLDVEALRNTVVLCGADGTFLRSSAALRILAGLGGLWRVVAALVWMIPRPLRDLLYRTVAKFRRSLFRRPSRLCPAAPKELAERFRS